MHRDSIPLNRCPRGAIERAMERYEWDDRADLRRRAREGRLELVVYERSVEIYLTNTPQGEGDLAPVRTVPIRAPRYPESVIERMRETAQRQRLRPGPVPPGIVTLGGDVADEDVQEFLEALRRLEDRLGLEDFQNYQPPPNRLPERSHINVDMIFTSPTCNSERYAGLLEQIRGKDWPEPPDPGPFDPLRKIVTIPMADTLASIADHVLETTRYMSEDPLSEAQAIALSRLRQPRLFRTIPISVSSPHLRSEEDAPPEETRTFLQERVRTAVSGLALFRRA